MTTVATLPKSSRVEIEEHSPTETVFLHLIPGVVVTLVFTILARFTSGQGLPAALALLLTWAVAGIPIELFILFYLGKQLNGRLSLEGIVLNREPISFRQYAWLVPLLLVWTAAWSTILLPLNESIRQALFGWWPGWLNLSDFASNLDKYPNSVLWTIVLLSAAMNIAVPIVEEFYFRGYLLPRIPAKRLLAPLIGVLLFSLYHVWLPWENPARIIALLPVVYAVQWKRNIHISIFVHVLLNSLGTIGLLVLVLGQT